MLDDLERLSDRDLDQLLCKLEARIRSAIAINDHDLIGYFLDEYLQAHDESSRRFSVWLERRLDGHHTHGKRSAVDNLVAAPRPALSGASRGANGKHIAVRSEP